MKRRFAGWPRIVLGGALLASSIAVAPPRPGAAAVLDPCQTGAICVNVSVVLTGDANGEVFTTDSNYLVLDGKLDCFLNYGVKSGDCVAGYQVDLGVKRTVYLVYLAGADSQVCKPPPFISSCGQSVSFETGALDAGNYDIHPWDFDWLSGRDLSVSLAGSGSGSVTSNPAGITCGGDCIHSYPVDSQVYLSASADAGSTFAGWSGGCTGTDPLCSVTMSSKTSVTATFNELATPPPTGTPAPATATPTATPRVTATPKPSATPKVTPTPAIPAPPSAPVTETGAPSAGASPEVPDASQVGESAGPPSAGPSAAATPTASSGEPSPVGAGSGNGVGPLLITAVALVLGALLGIGAIQLTRRRGT